MRLQLLAHQVSVYIVVARIVGPFSVVLVLCLQMLSSCASLKPASSGIAYTKEGVPYSRSACQTGRTDAEVDLRDGRIIVEDYGFPRKRQELYTKILQKRYRITVRTVGDLFDPQVIGHAVGYNEVSKSEIKRRFGRDVVCAVAVEVFGNQ